MLVRRWAPPWRRSSRGDAGPARYCGLVVSCVKSFFPVPIFPPCMHLTSHNCSSSRHAPRRRVPSCSASASINRPRRGLTPAPPPTPPARRERHEDFELSSAPSSLAEPVVYFCFPAPSPTSPPSLPSQPPWDDARQRGLSETAQQPPSPTPANRWQLAALLSVMWPACRSVSCQQSTHQGVIRALVCFVGRSEAQHSTALSRGGGAGSALMSGVLTLSSLR